MMSRGKAALLSSLRGSRVRLSAQPSLLVRRRPGILYTRRQEKEMERVSPSPQVDRDNILVYSLLRTDRLAAEEPSVEAIESFPGSVEVKQR